MIKRLIYWITNKRHCEKCCLFCKFYELCKDDKESANEDND
jgi:hypothetical protein